MKDITIAICLLMLSFSTQAQEIYVDSENEIYAVGELMLNENAVISNAKHIAYNQSMLRGTWAQNKARYESRIIELADEIAEVQRILEIESSERTATENAYLERYEGYVSEVQSFNWSSFYEGKQSETAKLIAYRDNISDFCTDWNEGESKDFYSSIVIIPSVCNTRVDNNGDAFQVTGDVDISGHGFTYADAILTITEEAYRIKISGLNFSLEKIDGQYADFIIAK